MFESEPLGEEHDLSQFDSDQPALDEWLRRDARQADAKRQGRTYIWHAEGDPVVVAYFTLCPHVLERAELPRRLGRGQPRPDPIAPSGSARP